MLSAAVVIDILRFKGLDASPIHLKVSIQSLQTSQKCFVVLFNPCYAE